MLRLILVLAVIAFGLRHAVRGPFYAVLFYLWYAYFRPEMWVWDSSFIESLNLSLIIGIFALMWALVSGQVTLNVRLSLIALLVFQSLISTMASDYTSYAWPYWVDFAKSAAITWLLASLVTDVARFRMVLLVMAISLGFEATKQGWVQLLLDPGGKNFNDSYLLGDNNGVAVGMWVLLAIFIALARTSSGRAEKWLHRFAATGVLYRGIATYSRGGFIAGGVMALFYFLGSKRKLAAVVALVIACGIIVPMMPAAFWDRMSTITADPRSAWASDPADQLSGDRASSLSRLHFWRVALTMVADRPFTGVGHNAYLAAFDRYDFSDGAFGKGRSVHSSWFGLLAELGYPGLALVAISLGLAWLACRRTRRLKGTSDEVFKLKEYANALETGLAVIVVGGAFVIFQYNELLWHLIGLTIALHRLTVAAEARLVVPVPAPAALPVLPVVARRGI
jgi:probable O-glycosylation ligase (exosortase A-associated)